jgi:hypothetical protein
MFDSFYNSGVHFSASWNTGKQCSITVAKLEQNGGGCNNEEEIKKKLQNEEVH